MATDGIREQVAAALLAVIQQIDGSAPFHYGTNDNSFRTRFYQKAFFADEFETIHMVRAGSVSQVREMSCEWYAEGEFFVLACRKEDDAESLPWIAAPGDGGPLPTTVQNRLVDDVEYVLNDSLALGLPPVGAGPSDRVDITGLEYGFVVTGWTCVEIVLRVGYYVPKRA